MSQFSIPPTYGEPTFEEPRPSWPTGLGIFGIIWGSLGVICGACAVGMTFAMGPIMEWAANMQAQGGQSGGGPQIPTTPMPPELMPNVVQVLGAVVHPIGAILLLVAGIMLTMRKPAARSAHLVYAGVSILGTVIGMVGVIIYANSFGTFAAANPDDAWVAMMQSSSPPAAQLIQTAVISLIALIYPIFVLIWFGFIKKRPEDMGPPRQELVA